MKKRNGLSADNVGPSTLSGWVARRPLVAFDNVLDTVPKLP